MASNFFGEIFRITTFGESHGKGIGVVIDGCPALLPLSEEEISSALSLRRPGIGRYTSPRKELDQAEILSGTFEGKTTGAPLAIWIANVDARSADYEEVKNVYRPGHANFSYLQKYGIFDFRGGGRASARETAARVAAGAVAKKLLTHFGISVVAFTFQIGSVRIETLDTSNLSILREKVEASPLFCPDIEIEQKMRSLLEEVQEEGDSLGGIVATVAHLPQGLGDPIYQKLEASLAFAMLSIPATKGFEIGEGFQAASLKGSEHNDTFHVKEKNVLPKTNRAGGTLGGISTGAPLFFRVALKPPSSIKKRQETLTLQGKTSSFCLSSSTRHDPCVAIRAVPVVEAMTALVLIDKILMYRALQQLK